MRFASSAQTTGEGVENWIVMAGDERRLEHHMPEQSSATADGALASRRAAIVCDWLKARKRGSLLTSDLFEFRHFSDQHRACHQADAGNRTQDVGGSYNTLIGRDGLFDPGFKLRVLMIQQLLQLFIYGLEHVGRAQFPVRLYLSQQPLSCLDELTAF